MINRFSRESTHVGLFSPVPPEMKAAIDRLKNGIVDASQSPEDIFVSSTAALALSAAGKGDPSKIASAVVTREISIFRLGQTTKSPFVSWELSDLASHSPLQPQHTDGE